jgi:hypothetical protein
MSYVPALSMSYTWTKGRALFPDGVTYTAPELIELASKTERPEDIRKLHMVKKIFNGEILQSGHTPPERFTKKYSIRQIAAWDKARIQNAHDSALRHSKPDKKIKKSVTIDAEPTELIF